MLLHFWIRTLGNGISIKSQQQRNNNFFLSLNLLPNAYTIENEIAPLGWAAAILLRGPFNTIGKEWTLAQLSQLMFAKRFGNENCCAALSHAVVTVEKWSVWSWGMHLSALWRAAGAFGLGVEFILATITRTEQWGPQHKAAIGKVKFWVVLPAEQSVWGWQALCFGHIFCSPGQWQKSGCALCGEALLLWINDNFAQRKELISSVKPRI